MISGEITCVCSECDKSTKFQTFKDAYMEGWLINESKEYVCYECNNRQKIFQNKVVDISYKK